jgi:4-hydroxy-tetrahydrodipicolinate synthase
MFLKGLYTALITPLTPKGELDEQGLREHLRDQLQHQIDGIVLLGTTGEAPTLTEKEKKKIIEIGIEEVKGRAQVLVGTGSYSTQQTIDNTRLAQEMGADAALIVTPYYNKPTQNGLYLHFQAICQAVSLPICVYNIQGRTGQNLQTQTLQRMLDFSSIIGVKEASGNISQMHEVIESIARPNPHFSVLSGDDALTLPLMALGGHGIISVISNLVPGPMKQLVQACLNEDFAQARLIHYQLSPLFKAAFIETNPIPIKAAMNKWGMAAGPCRLPLCELTQESEQKIEILLDIVKKNLKGH